MRPTIFALALCLTGCVSAVLPPLVAVTPLPGPNRELPECQNPDQKGLPQLEQCQRVNSTEGGN